MKNTEVTISPRGEMEFLFAEKTQIFTPTLPHISALEKPSGSLWALVESIEQNSLSCHDLVTTYAVLLQDIDDEAILAEVLHKGMAHYMLVLLQICVPILTGLKNMGATQKGEA